MNPIFLDYQSSTPLLPEVLEAMRPWWTENFANPSSAHRDGLSARTAILQARTSFASLLRAKSPEEITFTSNATEAISLAIRGVARASSRVGKHILLSSVEHPPVANTVDDLRLEGFTSTRVPVDAVGRFTAESFAAGFQEDTILVCAQLANGDAGTLQNVQELANFTNERGVPLLVDATYAAGSIRMQVQDLGLCMVALSPHRFFGPKGVGVLYRHRRCRCHPLITGGGQEFGRRAGTENVPAIIGGGVAADLLDRGFSTRVGAVQALQLELWSRLREIDGIQLIGPDLGPGRLPNHLSVSFRGVEGEGLMLAADLQGLRVHAGAACLGAASGFSPILQAMQVPPDVARGSVTLSCAPMNTAAEMEEASRILRTQAAKLRAIFES